MATLDMNLLVALDALLETSSVTKAAQRLDTSAPAMSRTLAKLRRVLGDPLLVRAGRNLVPTPRALEMRYDVSALVRQGRELLSPPGELDPSRLKRSFAVRAGDTVHTELVAPLLSAVRTQAPGVTLNIRPDAPEDIAALRDGRVDIEVGVIERTDPETTVQRIFGDRVHGVAAPDHPLITERVTVARFAAASHLAVSRHGRAHGPIDDRLALHGRTRRVVATVPDLTTALLAVRSGDVVCPAPAHLSRSAVAALGLRTFDIPLPLPEVPVSMAWHPRHGADSGHRWLRESIRTLLTPPVDSERPNGRRRRR
ncbi:LysR family transcriptional regulator [Nocardia arizonensis]|uniref:LysR family transcriptional regulator n=1 Tax=Nocardia arizonensis TaxID=1141647 RepID=UPI00157CD89D|nr:LysR family transcriptional regulator [Nocardia arizonensis]